MHLKIATIVVDRQRPVQIRVCQNLEYSGAAQEMRSKRPSPSDVRAVCAGGDRLLDDVRTTSIQRLENDPRRCGPYAWNLSQRAAFDERRERLFERQHGRSRALVAEGFLFGRLGERHVAEQSRDSEVDIRILGR